MVGWDGSLEAEKRTDDHDRRTDGQPNAEKSALEFKKLRQEILSDKIKTAAIAFGAISLVLTFALDRYKVDEQREFDRRTGICKSRIERMTEIAALSQQQLGDTTAALVKNRSRTWLLITNVLVIRSKLDSLKANDPEVIDLKRYFDAAIGQLKQAEASVDEWADAARVEALWRMQTGGYTPDFSALFGDDARQLWGDTATKAVEALEAVYSLSGQHETNKIEYYRGASEKLQTLVLEKINSAIFQCK